MERYKKRQAACASLWCWYNLSLTKDPTLVFRKVFEIIAIDCVFSANQGILHSDNGEKSKVGIFFGKIIFGGPRHFFCESKKRNQPRQIEIKAIMTCGFICLGWSTRTGT
jgi:hypothetical protein